MALVGSSKFFNYQGIFYNKVQASEMIIELGIEVAAAPSGNFLRDFGGVNPRSVATWHKFPALYEANFDDFNRDEKVGLTEQESGTIYLSPLQLIPVFNSFIIDRKATVIRKWNGTAYHEFIISNVKYLEPLYDSCLAVEINLKEAIRG